MSDELYDMLASLLADGGLDLVDLEVTHNEVSVFVDRPEGVDLEALASANRIVSAALDDLDPIPGRYTLNVSSPGLERRLRRPEHFARARGETVTARTRPGTGPVRRVTGVLTGSDDTSFVLEGPEVPGSPLHLRHDEVERARTVFEWGPSPKGGARPARAGGPGPAPRRGAPGPATGDDSHDERVTTR
ncbi:MAG TPA: ribosome maturation factor RimP [Acidimicrobiales bacterium]|nr:ribosome maturation factor RimP [Acidimicrobiales bacterium]